MRSHEFKKIDCVGRRERERERRKRNRNNENSSHKSYAHNCTCGLIVIRVLPRHLGR